MILTNMNSFKELCLTGHCEISQSTVDTWLSEEVSQFYSSDTAYSCSPNSY